MILSAVHRLSIDDGKQRVASYINGLYRKREQRRIEHPWICMEGRKELDVLTVICGRSLRGRLPMEYVTLHFYLHPNALFFLLRGNALGETCYRVWRRALWEQPGSGTSRATGRISSLEDAVFWMKVESRKIIVKKGEPG